MPRISEFFGIVITMNFEDHLPPHFHADYGEFKAAVAIETRSIVKGRLPLQLLSNVRNGAALHQPELLVVWEVARARRPLNHISPLV